VTRREELTEAAADYLLDHGLIGLSLRPLAAALGTSDRMLLYHFADKDDLVATVFRTAVNRGVAELEGLPAAADVRRCVLRLWEVSQRGGLEKCHRLYVEAAALGLLGQQPYVDVVRETNERWVAAVGATLLAAGCPADRVRRATYLLDAAFMGFQLDLPLDRGSTDLTLGVEDLADAVAAIAGPPADVIPRGRPGGRSV
jgi:AcrR family transcriptional regulator